MHLISLVLIAAVSILPPLSVSSIEQAFINNSPDLVSELFLPESFIQISLPEPISFSDLLSAEQARLLFRKIFSNFKTSEFFADPKITTFPGKSGGILRARWSFVNQQQGTMSVFRLYFYVIPSLERGTKSTQKGEFSPRIIEIRAEKI